MDLPKLEHDIIGRLRSSVSIEPRGLNDYRIALPFTYPDGDCIKIILKRNADSWELTDEGHTSMFLSYYNINLARAAQSSFLETVLTSHCMEDNDGRFIMHGIANGDIAGAVFTFTQGLLRISDLSLWHREVSKRNFKEDFRQAVISGVKGRDIVFDNYDMAHDTQRAYPIDRYGCTQEPPSTVHIRCQLRRKGSPCYGQHLLLTRIYAIYSDLHYLRWGDECWRRHTQQGQ